MPEEIFIIVCLAILSSTTLIIGKLVVDYLRDRSAAHMSDSSLTESQLRNLIQDAVEEAVAPLAARLDEREREARLLQRHLLPERSARDEPEVNVGREAAAVEREARK